MSGARQSADQLSWVRDGNDWPNRGASRFLVAGGLRWHVQDMGTGPALLLLHGTAASSHSWGGLAPLLAQHFRVVAPDLPGHAFTELPPGERLSLPGMAAATAALVAALELEPALVVGHSAGAAILARMCLDGAIDPRGLIGLNAALLPLRGFAGQFFSPAAKLLAGIPLVPRLVSFYASNPMVVDQLLRQTGSTVGAVEAATYRRLVRSPGHVAAALQMMANWDLAPLERELARLRPVLYLIACENDGAVPAAEARRLSGLLPNARLEIVPDLGHLGHEERPDLFAELILRIAAELQVLPAGG
jgi:magnesium chelatase accessory protein